MRLWRLVAKAVAALARSIAAPWAIPSSILTGLLYAYPSRRFRCVWFGLILHGADGLFFLVLILGLVLGLS